MHSETVTSKVFLEYIEKATGKLVFYLKDLNAEIVNRKNFNPQLLERYVAGFFIKDGVGFFWMKTDEGNYIIKSLTDKYLDAIVSSSISSESMSLRDFLLAGD